MNLKQGEFIMQDEKIDIIVFGASGSGESFILNTKNDNKYNILAFADNDKKKHNTMFNGYYVIAPEDISKFEYDEIIITSVFFPQIIKQLENELKINPNKIKLPPKSMTGNKKSYRPFSDKKTLELARETLLFIVDILEKENIPYFVDHGTLLGIVRDGDLIPWDDDIDISIYQKDMEQIITAIIDNVTKLPLNNLLNWVKNIYYDENNIPVQILLSFDEDNSDNYKNFPISIKSIIFKDGFAHQTVTYAPEYHFKNREYINYINKQISIPYEYKEYLEFHYGEWQKPKKDISFTDVNNYRPPTSVYKIR